MANPVLDNNSLEVSRATIYLGDTAAKPADYTETTMNTYKGTLVELGVVEVFTDENSEAYSFKDIQGNKHRLLDTDTIGITLANASHANYNALKTAFEASNQDILVVYGTKKATLEAGDEFKIYRDIPLTVSMPFTSNEVKRIMIDGEKDTETRKDTDFKIIETVVADA